jgi:hypothetical protein
MTGRRAGGRARLLFLLLGTALFALAVACSDAPDRAGRPISHTPTPVRATPTATLNPPTPEPTATPTRAERLFADVEESAREHALALYESGGIDDAEERMVEFLGWLASGNRDSADAEGLDVFADEQLQLIDRYPAGLSERELFLLAYLYDLSYHVSPDDGLPVLFSPAERAAFLDHPVALLLPEESLPYVGWYNADVRSFYAHWGSAGGLPVLGTASLSPEAFEWARAVYDRLILQMTACRPEVVEEMASSGMRVIAMGEGELVTSFPETFALSGEYDDELQGPVEEAAGLAGFDTLSGGYIVTPALDDWEGRWVGEVFIHELAHVIDLGGLSDEEHGYVAQLYDAAHAAGTWYGLYADSDAAEYFAEMSVYYLDASIDGLGRADVQAADPAMFEFLGTVYCQ